MGSLEERRASFQVNKYLTGQVRIQVHWDRESHIHLGRDDQACWGQSTIRLPVSFGNLELG